MSARPRSSGVQIEVLSESDYAEEEQRANEEAAQRREEERKRKAAAVAAAMSVAPVAATPAARATASSSSNSVGQAATSSSSNSRWPALLAPLHLPPFMATLHDTRVYDPASYARQSGAEVAAFQRTAISAFKDILAALEAATSTAAERGAAPAELRAFLTPLLCACIRFLLPPLPPAPSPLSAPALSVTGRDSDVASSDDWDPDSLPPSMAERAPTFEFVWQNEILTARALQALQKLALLFRNESATESIDGATAAAEVSFSGADVAAAAAGNIESVMSAPLMQRFFTWVLPTHLLPFLRQEMRSSTSTSAAASSNSSNDSRASAVASMLSSLPGAADQSLLAQSTQEWKHARHFPSAFFVCFLAAHLSPATLASQLRPLLVLLLPLLDDHELHLKVAGLVALQRLVRVVPSLHFGDGWGALLLRSLQTAVSFKEASILALAIPVFVQTHMALFPPILLHDYSLLQQLHPSLTADPKSAGSSVASSSSSSDVVARLAAHEALMEALLHEMSYLALSPSLDNLFATFVYAQTLLPTLLYVGPLVLCKRMQTLLPIVLQWCSSLTAPVQRRLVKLGWENLECMLTLSIVADRLAEQHAARIIEAAAQAWINDEEITQQQQRRQQAQQKSKPAIVRTADTPLSDPLFHVRYSSQSTIAHCLQLLRRLVPNKFELIWHELQQMPELAGLVVALRKEDAQD